MNSRMEHISQPPYTSAFQFVEGPGGWKRSLSVDSFPTQKEHSPRGISVIHPISFGYVSVEVRYVDIDCAGKG